MKVYRLIMAISERKIKTKLKQIRKTFTYYHVGYTKMSYIRNRTSDTCPKIRSVFFIYFTDTYRECIMSESAHVSLVPIISALRSESRDSNRFSYTSLCAKKNNITFGRIERRYNI